MMDDGNVLLLKLTSQIVSAHVANAPTSVDSLPYLINSIYEALSGRHIASIPAEPLQPAVAINRSVFPAYIICLEDGRRLKLLKRHLQASYGLTPEEYRKRWGLPANYPMVAPNYASQRSRLAKVSGLGRLQGTPAAVAGPVKRKRSLALTTVHPALNPQRLATTA